MELGLVSIITPVYNSERFLSETIKSVKKQNYKNWEMLIINDCSNDGSENIVKKYAKEDKRIKYIKLKKRSGVVNARNIGLEKAKGQYIAFLDSDDVWKENKLSRHIEVMEDKGCAFTFSSYDTIDENGKNRERTVYVPDKITYEGYLKNTIIGCLTVMVDKAIVGDFKMVDAQIEDFATWLQILKKIDYACGIKEVLAQYRIVKGASSYNKVKAARGAWKVYRNVEKFNPIIASKYFSFYFVNTIKKRVKLTRSQ